MSQIIKYLLVIGVICLCIANFQLALISYVSFLAVLFTFIFIQKFIKGYKYIPVKLISNYWLLRTKLTHKIERIYKKRSYQQDYAFYLKSKRWNDIKSTAISSMQCECEFCKAKPVQVHHIFYPNKRNYGYEGIASLIVVCDKCHKVLHGNSLREIKSLCPLCTKSISKISLKIDLKHYELTEQLVCLDCYQIAVGKRYKSKNLTFLQYLKFIRNWQLTLWDKF